MQYTIGFHSAATSSALLFEIIVMDAFPIPATATATRAIVLFSTIGAALAITHNILL